MILETYQLTPYRKGQKQILDFINLFRAHTEKGYNAIQGIIQINDLAVLPRQPPITPQLGVAVYIYQVEPSYPSHNQGSRPVLFSYSNQANISSLSRSSYASVWQRPQVVNFGATHLASATHQHQPSSQPKPNQPQPKPHQQPHHQPHPKPHKPVSNTNSEVINLILIQARSVTVCQAIQVRDRINKALGKVAICRVHLSPRNNIVLTCFYSTPEELLEHKPKWEKNFAN